MGNSPFHAAYGFQPPAFPSSEPDSTVPSVAAHLRRARAALRNTRAALARTSEQNQRVANRHRTPAPCYQVGQEVWLSSRDLPLAVDSRKLGPRFVGPYPITRIINRVTVKLCLPDSMKCNPVFHVSRIKPVTSCPLSLSEVPPPPPRLVDGHPAFTVKAILYVRRRGRGFQFLVDWEGYGPEERSWVSRSLILDPQLLTDVYNRFPEKPVYRPPGTRTAGRTCSSLDLAPTQAEWWQLGIAGSLRSVLTSLHATLSLPEILLSSSCSCLPSLSTLV
uniref:uncharacterized protein LOC131129193 n=1 Tax=Doryrhamphus excisus TaxID=161450 RepID=UPI0025AE0E88|nr:uncharacterized protein LOC131129193 [Doryrhamphus excisus]